MKTSHVIVAAIAMVAILAVGTLTGYITPETGVGLSVAMAVQSAYSDNISAAKPGQVATMATYDADSRICETAAGIGFGLACGRGSADRGAVLGASAAADFVGISVADITLVGDTTDEYSQYDEMAVMVRGDIWVTVGGDVADGGDVTFNATTGVLSSAGTSGSQFAISGARWLTTATSGNLAKLRLSGHMPSA